MPPPDTLPPLPLFHFTLNSGASCSKRQQDDKKAPNDANPGVRGGGPRVRVYALLNDVLLTYHFIDA